MNVLSLFDGMSCGRLALDRAGIKVDSYYASEIDKYAQIVSNANYPNIIRVGDVTKWREWGINWFEIDMVIAGSPCQGFSFAGKQLAFDDPRSKLFFEFVDILKFVRLFNPNVKFLLENVKMKKDYLNTISKCIGVEPVCINSSLMSAQNRVRYYWANWDFEQPEDRGILLKDILEDGSNQIGAMRGRYLVNGKRQDGKMKVAGLTTQRIEQRKDHKSNCLTTVGKDNLVILGENSVFTDRDKSYCIDANYAKGISWEQYKKKCRRQLVIENGNVRKLTPLECERLQTVPDNYTNHVSNSQRYKMLGNGWTVDVIAHIFSYLK